MPSTFALITRHLPKNIGTFCQYCHFSHTMMGQKKDESQLRFLIDYLLFCQTLWGRKRQSIQVFSQNFWVPFCTHSVVVYPFLICRVLKKAKFSPLRSKMTITPNFLKKIIQDFVQGIYERCGFSTEIYKKKLWTHEWEFWLKVT